MNTGSVDWTLSLRELGVADLLVIPNNNIRGRGLLLIYLQLYALVIILI